MSTLKVCCRCKKLKKLDQFQKESRKSDGRRGACGECLNGRVPQAKSEPIQEGVVCDVQENQQVVTLISKTVRTLNQALVESKVDLDVWEVERFVANKWDMGAKLGVAGSERVAVTELWQVKVWFKRKFQKRTEDGISALVKRMNKFSPIFKKFMPTRITSPHMLEVSISDAHFAKLAWAPETGGENYDLSIVESIYDSAVKNLVSKASGFSFDKILLPVGNDFFHVDGYSGMTANGTPQDTDGRYVKMFEVGQMAVVNAISYLQTIAPVEVLWVPGNHDRTSSWHLVHTLRAWFRKCKHVKVNDSPTQRKYVLYGKNMIAFTHGDEEAHNQLPAIMATEQPRMWAASQWRTVHLGHFHKRRETRHVGVDTHGGVVVSVLPSLSAHDAWTTKKGYVGNRAADAYIYSRENGPVGYVTANVIGERLVA